MSDLPTAKTADGLRVRMSPWFKLKNKPGRNYMAVELEKAYGFMPSTIIVERDTSRNNVIRINAVLSDEEAKKEDAWLKKTQKRQKETRKKLEEVANSLSKEGGKNDSTEQKPASTQENKE